MPNSNPSTAQDMQVTWTPANIKLGEQLGFFTFGDLAETPTEITFHQETMRAGLDLEFSGPCDIHLPNLVSIDPENGQGGSLTIGTGLTCDAPALAVIGGGLSAFGATMDLPVLTTLGGTLTVSGSLELPSLATLGGDLTANLAASALSFPALTAITGSLYAGKIITASFPVLATIGGSLDAAPSTDVTLSLPSLSAISGSIEGSGSSGLVLNLPALETIGGLINASASTALTLNLPALVTVTSSIQVFNSTFSALDLSAWVPTDGTTINFSGCNLTATMVEQILRRCVLAGVATCVINVSGGTNAAVSTLSDQGKSDATALGSQLTATA